MPRNILSRGLSPTPMGGRRVGVTFMGDWSKFTNLIHNQEFLITQAAIQGQINAAKKYKTTLRDNIRTGGKRFGYPPLSPGYLSHKKTKAKVLTPFIFTFSLYNAIRVIFNKSKIVSVGIPKGIYKSGNNSDSSNNLPIHEYANILENGSYSSNIPKRPIFKDTYIQIGGASFVGKKITEQLLIVYKLFKISPK